MAANTYDMQLFLYDRQQRTAKVLTKDFDPNVESVKVLPDRFEAIFTAENQDYVSLYRLDLRSCLLYTSCLYWSCSDRAAM